MVYRILVNTLVFEIKITASEFISTYHYDIAVGFEKSFILTWLGEDVQWLYWKIG